MIRRRKDWVAKPTKEGWAFWPPGRHTDFISIDAKLTREQARTVLALVREAYAIGKRAKAEALRRALGIDV